MAFHIKKDQFPLAIVGLIIIFIVAMYLVSPQLSLSIGGTSEVMVYDPTSGTANPVFVTEITAFSSSEQQSLGYRLEPDRDEITAQNGRWSIPEGYIQMDINSQPAICSYNLTDASIFYQASFDPIAANYLFGITDIKRFEARNSLVKNMEFKFTRYQNSQPSGEIGSIAINGARIGGSGQIITTTDGDG